MLLRKRIIEETPELTKRLNTELQIIQDLIWATEQGGDCLDPAVIQFQKSCHIITKNNHMFMQLELLQSYRKEKPTPTVASEPFLF